MQSGSLCLASGKSRSSHWPPRACLSAYTQITALSCPVATVQAPQRDEVDFASAPSHSYLRSVVVLGSLFVKIFSKVSPSELAATLD